MTSPSWPAPAKINLFLHVVGRREDGYHLLQSVFQFLDVSDGLQFCVRRDGVVRRLGEVPGVTAEQDLLVRAARLLQTESGTDWGVDITIEKRLPMGAGLGGGSSDAATTLVALNHLWNLQLSVDCLAALGLRLGADVPVFVRGHAAWAEGVGEQLTPLDLPQPWYVVLVPPCHVSTAEIFRAPELTRNARPITIAAFLTGAGVNVCEPVVRRHYPEVGAALDWLARYAPARMSGTGAAVFAAFPDEAQARAVASEVPRVWRVLVARGRNTSPLQERLTWAGSGAAS